MTARYRGIILINIDNNFKKRVRTTKLLRGKLSATQIWSITARNKIIIQNQWLICLVLSLKDSRNLAWRI